MIEVGGAYAHKFIPFLEFLELPSLIITDIDSINNYYENPDVDFLIDLRAIIYSLRNSTFHFTTANVDKDSWNKKLIGEMFEKESNLTVRTLKNKFYTNNLHIFYSENDLKLILDKLYHKCLPRESQVPAFNNVFIRKHFPEELIRMGLNPVFKENENQKEDTSKEYTKTKEKWQSALYYLFKEIYYNAFLSCVQAAKNQHKEVWIPAGTFHLEQKRNLVVSDVTIRGAGMWYSNLVGLGAAFDYSGTCKFYDFSMTGLADHRLDAEDLPAFGGTSASTNCVIENIWMEHERNSIIIS